jgi:hypothetical protein
MLPTKLRSFDKAVSEKIFLEINQKHELPAVAMFVMGGYGFLLRSNFFFRTTQELVYFFLSRKA